MNYIALALLRNERDSNTIIATQKILDGPLCMQGVDSRCVRCAVFERSV